jgi:O-antigen ligase
MLGFFFALTGALIATSIVSIGDSGIPVFMLALIVPFVAAPLTGFASRSYVLEKSESRILFGLGIVSLILCAVTFLQIASNVQPASLEIPHAIVRISFLAYCAVCIYSLHGDTLAACLRWLRRILIVVALYGIYQVPAKLLGLPLFLDWLRNNPSFGLYDYNTAGWVSLVRSTSIYAEPSQGAAPVLILVLLNLYLPAPRNSRVVGWAAALLFAALTFSRTIWLALLIVALSIWLARSNAFRRNFARHRRLFAVLLLLAALLTPVWAFLGSNYKSDKSRQERAGSIVIGLEIVKQHPWIGSGWNSYQTLMPAYSLTYEDLAPSVDFKTIHNMFVSYTEQAGIGGFIFAFFPFIIMLFYSQSPLGLKLGSVLPLFMAAELGGDIAYASLFWLWVAILIKWDSRFLPKLS